MWAEPILFEYLRFKIPVGRDQNTQFCTEHWRIWAFRCGQEQHISISSILNSFQKASKHPIFSKNTGESGLSGVGKNNITWVHSIKNDFGKAPKHPVLHRTLENLGFQVWAGLMLFEHLLFNFCLRRHNHTQFCTEHWRIWAFRRGQEKYYVSTFYLKWLWEGTKTPSFALNIGESRLSGVGRINII